MGLTCYVCKHHEDDHGCPWNEPSQCEQDKCACNGTLITWEDGMESELVRLRAERDRLAGEVEQLDKSMSVLMKVKDAIEDQRDFLRSAILHVLVDLEAVYPPEHLTDSTKGLPALIYQNLKEALGEHSS